jgi:hypothetical protein
MSDEITVPTAPTDERPYYLASEHDCYHHDRWRLRVVIGDARRPEPAAIVYGDTLAEARASAWRVATLLNDEEERGV